MLAECISRGKPASSCEVIAKGDGLACARASTCCNAHWPSSEHSGLRHELRPQLRSRHTVPRHRHSRTRPLRTDAQDAPDAIGAALSSVL